MVPKIHASSKERARAGVCVQLSRRACAVMIWASRMQAGTWMQRCTHALAGKSACHVHTGHFQASARALDGPLKAHQPKCKHVTTFAGGREAFEHSLPPGPAHRPTRRFPPGGYLIAQANSWCYQTSNASLRYISDCASNSGCDQTSNARALQDPVMVRRPHLGTWSSQGSCGLGC